MLFHFFLEINFAFDDNWWITYSHTKYILKPKFVYGALLIAMHRIDTATYDDK